MAARARPDPSPAVVTLSVTDAARSFSDVVNRARYRGERFVLTKGGVAIAEIAPLRIGIRASELRARFRTYPRLTKADAKAMERDIEAARREVGSVERDPWE